MITSLLQLGRVQGEDSPVHPVRVRADQGLCWKETTYRPCYAWCASGTDPYVGTCLRTSRCDHHCNCTYLTILTWSVWSLIKCFVGKMQFILCLHLLQCPGGYIPVFWEATRAHESGPAPTRGPGTESDSVRGYWRGDDSGNRPGSRNEEAERSARAGSL